MKTEAINSLNFKKFCVQKTDYNSAQAQYLADISSKLNQKNGADTYTRKIEKLGYDVCAEPAPCTSNGIRMFISKKYTGRKDLPYRMPVAQVGDYTTDFNPQDAINKASEAKRTENILGRALLAIASIFAVLAIVKACGEQNINKVKTTFVEQVGAVANKTAGCAKTFHV